MSSNVEDPSFVVQMLEEFRSGRCSERRVSRFIPRSSKSSEIIDSQKRKQVTDDDEAGNDSAKFPKLDVSPKVTNANTPENNRSSSPPMSPWENHRIRSQLLEANIKISELENQIGRHHSIREEMESLFKKERESLQKQVDSEKYMIKELENHLQGVRKREIELKEELKHCKTTLNKDKIHFEERIQELQGENAKLLDSLREIEQNLKNEIIGKAKLVQHLREQVQEKEEQFLEISKRNSDLEERFQDRLLFQTQFEQVTQELQNSIMKIKELEKERDDYLEASTLVKTQQDKVFHYSEIEKELAVLKEENSNLKKIVPKHLLLEEVVEGLKTRQAVSEEQAHELAWAQGRLSNLQTVLDEWHKVARDYCDGYMSSSHLPDPAIIQKRINELQKRVQVLTSDLLDVKSQLNDTRQKKESLTIELQTAKKEIEKFQTMNEQLNGKLRVLQKKLQIVITERDSYRLQMDSYEKDLTISSTGFVHPVNQYLQQKLDHSERTLENYRKMLEKLETEIDKSKGFAGPEVLEKLNRLEIERSALLQEKEQLKKRINEFEVQMEYRAIKGDFNPIESKVFHFRMNPRAEAEAQYEDEVTTLRAKCARLEERIKLLEEGNVHDITRKVEENVASSNSQEIRDLQEKINSQETKMQRLKEIFHASAKEFREVCYELFGYKIDRNENNIYKLTSMYADSPDDHLMFKLMPDGSIDMMETSYSATLGELINLHLHHHNSPPLFLGAVTVELYNRQTLSQTMTQTIELN